MPCLSPRLEIWRFKGNPNVDVPNQELVACLGREVKKEPDSPVSQKAPGLHNRAIIFRGSDNSDTQWGPVQLQS